MKKLFFTLLLASGIAQAAPAVTGEYHIGENTITNAGYTSYLFAVSEKISKSTTGDVSALTSQTDVTGTLTQRLEGGVTYRPSNWAYVRGAVGQRFSNTGNNTYYSVEPGVNYSYSNLRFRVGYRIRDAVNPDTYGNQTEKTMRYRVGYAVTKQDTVTVGADRSTGDINTRSVMIGYTRSF
jgi:hypothetical protein